MTQHTKGSHLPTAYETVAGATAWWTEPCYCDRVQPLNQNAIGAGGQAQQWFGTVTITNPAVANTNTQTIVPGTTYTWPDWNTIYVPPAQIHYHYCQHEEVNKHLLELIKILIEKLEAKK